MVSKPLSEHQSALNHAAEVLRHDLKPRKGRRIIAGATFACHPYRMASGSAPPGNAALEVALDLDAVHAELSGQSATEIVAWAQAQFGEALVTSSSFGAHSAVMLHLTVTHAPGTRVVLIDTGYLFDETYHFVETLRDRLDFELHIAQPCLSAAHQEALYGKLWEQGDEGVERYLELNKVEPMQRALETLGTRAWLAGLRANQTSHRRAMRIVERQNGRYKIHPILGWSEEDMVRYLQAHRLPLHPLVEQGYRSIGDWHSTLPTAPDQDPREGRILGKQKECGIHLNLDDDQNASLTSSSL